MEHQHLLEHWLPAPGVYYCYLFQAYVNFTLLVKFSASVWPSGSGSCPNRPYFFGADVQVSFLAFLFAA